MAQNKKKADAAAKNYFHIKKENRGAKSKARGTMAKKQNREKRADTFGNIYDIFEN